VTLTVPELTPELRELKERVRRFVEDEGYPVEARIAARGAIDPEEIDALRGKARAAGFSQLNMARELGGQDLSMVGQVALEEASSRTVSGSPWSTAGPRSCTRSSRRSSASAT
jgi:alkylation response protein AidB-like acyl-CoA dehydrogenase